MEPSDQQSGEGSHLAVICEEHGLVATAMDVGVEEEDLAKVAKIHHIWNRLKRPVRGPKCDLNYGKVEYVE